MGSMLTHNVPYDLKYVNHNHAGSLMTAALHVFSVMVGPGVLALPNAASWLGWIFAPILLTMFYCISLLVSSMLVSVYEVRGSRCVKYNNKWEILTRCMVCDPGEWSVPLPVPPCREAHSGTC